MVPFAIAGITIGLSLTTGMLIAGGDRTATTTMIPIPVVPPAVTITTPQAAAPPVNVTVTTPPPAPVEAPPKPDYRALTPKLDPSCLGIDGDADSPLCTWDDGFPAISADGKTIVDASPTDDGGRGYPGLMVTFTDAATSKAVRTILVLDPNDHDPDNPTNEKVRAKVAKRAAAAQKLIDAGDYRSLIDLGGSTLGSTSTSADTTGIHAEFAGESMRLVDPATRTTLWRHRFSAPSPIAKPNYELECQGWSLAQVNAWWDPTTRIVVGNLLYHHGGCMCGSSSITQVFKL
jgi:hypothetical protein